MGLKSFLKEQGFVVEETSGKEKESATRVVPNGRPISPTFFPIPADAGLKPGQETNTAAPAPPFVAPLQNLNSSGEQQPDPTFVKFFEDELSKANIAGPDYFEFRQQLSKTQQRMAAKGVAAPEVVLQAVLMSFESQDISSTKLAEAARYYKKLLRQKKDDFLTGALNEKNNQLQKRQAALQSKQDQLNKMEQQLQQLETQKKQLEEAVNKGRTQLEADKSLGREGIDKIERAEKLIGLAHDYIQSTIDTDILRLESL